MSRHRSQDELRGLTSRRSLSDEDNGNGGGGGGGAHQHHEEEGASGYSPPSRSSPIAQHRAGVSRVDSLLSTALTILLSLILIASVIESPNHRALRNLPRDACQLDVSDLVKRHGLTPRFHYSRTFALPSSREREADPTLASGRFDPQPRDVTAPLVQGFDLVDGGASTRTSLSRCSPSSVVDVPFFAPHAATRTQGRNILVGYATTTDRIRKWTPMLQHSFAHTGLHLVLQLPPHEDGVDLGRHLNSLGIRTTIIHDDAEYRIRWARLPKHLYPLTDEHTQWIMVSDDDTFVLSLPRILAVLDKYDASQHHFVGTLSDKWGNMVFGPESFGGGGTWLSVPLVKHLLPHWENYALREELVGGDQRLSWCVFENSYARLSWEPTVFTQNDAEGDIQGLFESGQRFGTFHHLSWRVRQHNETLLAFAARACGKSSTECLLQRFLFPPSTTTDPTSPSPPPSRFMYTHGWSIVRYPSSHLPDFGRTEYTWEHGPQDYWSHGMGPLRDKVEERGRETRLDGPWKESWFLAEVQLGGEGRGELTRHTYVKRGGIDGLDSVIELFWL